jgi:transketolase
MMAGKERLYTLTAIVDRNNIQIDGFTEDIMPLEPLADKWRAFGWHVLEIDGHNIKQIIEAVDEARAIYEKPTVILAHTIPGKGVSFMERRFEWHGKPPNPDEANISKHLWHPHKTRPYARLRSLASFHYFSSSRSSL